MNVEGWYLLTVLFFFCIITNSLYPACNYLWIGFFLSCSKKVLQLPVLCMVCECLTSHPNFFVFQIVCLYLYLLLLPVWGVCLHWFSAPFSAGELELPWRPANEQCFKGNVFYYCSCALISAVQVGYAFFTWSGNPITLGSGLPFAFFHCCCYQKCLQAVADGAGGEDWAKHLILY